MTVGLIRNGMVLSVSAEEIFEQALHEAGLIILAEREICIEIIEIIPCASVKVPSAFPSVGLSLSWSKS